MTKLLIFNPDTDFARAETNPGYIPKKNVAALRSQLALLPALFADRNDFILVPETFSTDVVAADTKFDNPNSLSSRLLLLVSERNLQVVKPTDIKILLNSLSTVNLEIIPWGWDRYIRRELLNLGIDSSLLPTDEELDTIRRLSHRKTALELNRIISSTDSNIKVNLARMLTSADDVLAFACDNDHAWLKAPWSSSGRGILRAVDSSPEKIRQWTHAIIRKQGCVMAEHQENKLLDFASEWMIENGKTFFIGLSMFNISGRGKYDGNILMSPSEMFEFINSKSDGSLRHILDIQKASLPKMLKGYNGPLGVDMMVRKDRTINPCVEINLRYTMGYIAIKAVELWPDVRIINGLNITFSDDTDTNFTSDDIA